MDPKYALHYASHTEIARLYEKLKRRRKSSNFVTIAALIGIAQFLPIPAFFCKGGAPFPSKVVKGHYYFSTKSSGWRKVTRGQFLLGWCSGILFIVSFPVCAVAGAFMEKADSEIKKIEPRLG